MGQTKSCCPWAALDPQVPAPPRCCSSPPQSRPPSKTHRNHPAGLKAARLAPEGGEVLLVFLPKGQRHSGKWLEVREGRAQGMRPQPPGTSPVATHPWTSSCFPSESWDGDSGAPVLLQSPFPPSPGSSARCPEPLRGLCGSGGGRTRPLLWGSDFGCLSPCLEVPVSVLVAILPRAPSWLVQGDPRPRGQGQCVFPVGCWC